MINVPSVDTAPPAADWKSPTVATSTTTVVRPSRQWRSGYARKLVVGDTIVVVFAVGVAYWLRFNVLPVTGYAVLDYPVVSSLVIIGWLLALAVCRTRSPRVVGEGAEEYRRVVVATLSVFSGIAIVSMLLKLEITEATSRSPCPSASSG